MVRKCKEMLKLLVIIKMLFSKNCRNSVFFHLYFFQFIEYNYYTHFQDFLLISTTNSLDN